MISRISRGSGFSHAVVAGGTVYLAGQTAPGSGDVVAQFDGSLANLLTALAAAGGSASDLVQLTIYVVDLPAYRARGKEIGEVWRRHCGRDYPAVAAVGVERLWDADALVEIAGIAVITST